MLLGAAEKVCRIVQMDSDFEEEDLVEIDNLLNQMTDTGQFINGSTVSLQEITPRECCVNVHKCSAMLLVHISLKAFRS